MAKRLTWVQQPKQGHPLFGCKHTRRKRVYRLVGVGIIGGKFDLSRAKLVATGWRCKLCDSYTMPR